MGTFVVGSMIEVTLFAFMIALTLYIARIRSLFAAAMLFGIFSLISAGMLIGRLELMSVYVLFTISFWRR